MTSTAVAAPSPQLPIKFLEAFAGRLDRLSPQQQTQFLMALGQHIGVRAELGEVILYQGKPYITIDGRYRQAHSTGLLTGLEVRPASGLERRNYGAGEGVALWIAMAWRRGAPRPFQGWGEAGGMSDKNPISKDQPAKMAKKRARYDALRAAFPVGEDVTALHREYIEEAEMQAASEREVRHPLIAATYDAPADMDGEDGHDEAADANSGTGDGAKAAGRVGRKPVDQLPKRQAPRVSAAENLEDRDPYRGPALPVSAPAEGSEGPNAERERATPAQLARIRQLIVHPSVPGAQRQHIEERMTRYTRHAGDTCIAALETQIAGPKGGPSTGQPSADGELGLGDKPTGRDAIREGR